MGQLAIPTHRRGILAFESDSNSGVLFPCVDDQAKPTESGSNRWSRAPWWVWLLVVLFPMVLRPWWMAIISIALYVLFLRLILGPFPIKRNSN